MKSKCWMPNARHQMPNTEHQTKAGKIPQCCTWKSKLKKEKEKKEKNQKERK